MRTSSPPSVTLLTLDLFQFKNFSYLHVNLPPAGFCLVQGENGAGKSCLLEGIAFALGQSLQRLRISHWAALRHQTSSATRAIPAATHHYSPLAPSHIVEASLTVKVQSKTTVLTMAVEKKGHRKAFLNRRHSSISNYTTWIHKNLGVMSNPLSSFIGQVGHPHS